VGRVTAVLSIETATTACAIALTNAAGQSVERVLDTDRHHTEVLTAGIREALQELGMRPHDVTRVAVDIGPGLFTGLRVGVATAISFAQAVGAGLVAVTSLELLAHGAFARDVRGHVVSVVDGRRGEVFVQDFVVSPTVAAVSDPVVTTPEICVARWEASGEPVTFTGDGVARYRDLFAALPNGSIFEQSIPYQPAAIVLGAMRSPTTTVSPLYLRDADAVANFSTRDRS
jgi:tRNA threonylcarbamoyladenosine biosynthesis protein TsaB